MKESQVENLLYEALETEMGGVQVYTNAVECAQNEDLKKEWEEYLEQTQRHEEILREVFDKLGLDPEKETPGRRIVRHQGESLVEAIQMARKGGEPEGGPDRGRRVRRSGRNEGPSELELIGEVSKKATGETKKVLSEAHDEVEDEEDEHLYHTMGWSRELWMDSLGLPAVLPPPEEEKDVKTAIGAARAKQSRKEMLRGGKSDRRSA
jgi:rubrerythrin